MRVLWMLVLMGLVGCDGPLEDGCREADLSSWCRHQESGGGGPVGSETCDVPTVAPDAVESCGYRYSTPSAGFTSMTHYFDAATDEHVATVYTTDTNTYCGGFSYTYGERVDLDCD